MKEAYNQVDLSIPSFTSKFIFSPKSLQTTSSHLPSTQPATMASSNPSNFSNLPKDELREIAAKGGHASHGGGAHTRGVFQPLPAVETLPLTDPSVQQRPCRPQRRWYLHQGIGPRQGARCPRQSHFSRCRGEHSLKLDTTCS